MQVDFHASSMGQSPKYTGAPKYESTSCENKTDEKNYTLKTIGLNNSNETIRVVYSTYENGRLVKEWADFDGDDIADVIDEWEYDEKEKLETWKKDFDGDGKVDCVEKNKFDEYGNINAWGIDTDMDNNPEQKNLYTYVYNENGNMISYRANFDGDELYDRTEELEYDENGNLTKRLINYDNDSFLDEKVTYGYNAAGGLTDETHEYYLKDGSTKTKTLMYDGNGNLITKATK